MNEIMLSDILEKICMDEADAISDSPVPKLSFRHRRKMKRIFSTYEKSLRLRKKYRFGSIKRVILVVTVIFLAMFTITAGAVAIRGFKQNKHRNYTELLTANAENCPKTIENVYYLPEIPEGYELYEVNPDNRNIYTAYINRNTNRYLTFEQSVKEGYKVYFDTERQDFEELDFNGHFALYLGSRDTKNQYGCIVWDDGDYILEISGDFTKDELVTLAKSAKF